MSNQPSVTQLAKAVAPFFPKAQLGFVIENTHPSNEERNYFIGVLQSFKETFEKMPKTYQTNSIDNHERIVHLHYFVGGYDWWIIEKDMEDDQLQAYGVYKMPGCRAKFGYISLERLTELHVRTPSGLSFPAELDFHWEPTKLGDIPELKELFCESVC